MERWSLGLKSVGTRPLGPEEWKRIAMLRRGFRMRAVKLGLGCALWFLIMPAMMAARTQLRGVEGWALLIWFAGMLGAPLLWIRWVMNGWMRAHRLSRDLRGGLVERLMSPAPSERQSVDGNAAGRVVEVLPTSAFVVTDNGVPNENWVVAPIAAVNGPRHLAWLDFFDGRAAQDRMTERPMTKEEQEEIARLAKRSMKTPIQMWVGSALLSVSLLVMRSSFSWIRVEDDIVRKTLLGMALFVMLPPLTVTPRRALLAYGLRRDRAQGKVRIVAFGEASRAANSPDSIEYLELSRRVWSINGMPAPWRIVDEFARY